MPTDTKQIYDNSFVMLAMSAWDDLDEGLRETEKQIREMLLEK